MPEFTSHAPGTFCWPELATTDQKGAVAFYRDLVGWDVAECPIGPDGVYSMFQTRGLDAGAAYTMRDEERKAAPPHWNMYVAVESADAAAARVKELGATVMVEPFDVMDLGRMAVIQDPSGAVFEVWEAKTSPGAKVLYEPGALCWSELMTADPKASEAFYTSLFGWTPKHAAPDAPMQYTEFKVAGAEFPSIGMLPKPPHVPKEVPPYWMPYFQVADLDAAAAKAKALGAQVHFGPQDIPNAGRFVVLGDPQGAVFAAFQMTGQ